MGNKAGSVWNVNLIDLNQAFDKSFSVNLGCNSGQWGGADGMVFALQPGELVEAPSLDSKSVAVLYQICVQFIPPSLETKTSSASFG